MQHDTGFAASTHGVILFHADARFEDVAMCDKNSTLNCRKTYDTTKPKSLTSPTNHTRACTTLMSSRDNPSPGDPMSYPPVLGSFDVACAITNAIMRIYTHYNTLHHTAPHCNTYCNTCDIVCVVSSARLRLAAETACNRFGSAFSSRDTSCKCRWSRSTCVRVEPGLHTLNTHMYLSLSVSTQCTVCSALFSDSLS